MRSRKPLSWVHDRTVLTLCWVFAVLVVLIGGYTISQTLIARSANSSATLSANQAFTQAFQGTGVPVEVLKAICYLDGRMSNNGGEASIDNGYGCMDLVKNQRFDTLDKAAQKLGVSVDQLKQNMTTNIAGGAFILRSDALQLSPTLPANLADWYGAVALYSHVSTRQLALMFADDVYKTIQRGFRITTDQGEVVTLAARAVKPNTATATVALRSFAVAANLPNGCTNDGKVDYPGALDCILTSPTTYDCNDPQSPNNCNYTSSNRPSSCTVQTTSVQPCNVDQIVIHDTEGSLASALNEFMCLGKNVNASCKQSSVHYIVDTDGTVYQVIRDKDIAYHDGNFWSNTHSIGIEHIGFDATGYRWYNTAQYKASARLVAYLAKTYTIPLDHAHIVSHGTVPAATLASSPNHVDPGPYWLWDYYLKLIAQYGGGAYRADSGPPGTITLHPSSDQRPAGSDGAETKANYSFFSLYTRPSTKSSVIPQQGHNDHTDVSYNVEADVNYAFVKKASDDAGTGDTMYEIWYGEEDQVHKSNSSYYADAKLAWLAVPSGDGVEGQSPAATPPSGTGVEGQPPIATPSPGISVEGQPQIATPSPGTSVEGQSPIATPSPGISVEGQPPTATPSPGTGVGGQSQATIIPSTRVTLSSNDRSALSIYSQPVSGSTYVIGGAPSGAIFATALTVTEDNTNTTWYEISYNHRQAWIPASETSTVPTN
jgi:N-acetylmuramoyl-L-alanine amidase-like protein